MPGSLSVIDQISLFSGARIVIGVHGGGLTNVVFCLDDAVLYELLQNNCPNSCFNRLAQAKGLDYWADMFVLDGADPVHLQSWEVDLELFKRRFAAIRESARPSTFAGARGAPPSATTNR